MDKSSKLIPSNIIAQCDEAIATLEDSNRCLLNVMSNVAQFTEDTSIQSEAFDAMRQQIENYCVVINLMRSANLADIEDYNQLKGMVGSENLDGAMILEQLEEAKRQRQESLNFLEECSSNSSATNDATRENNLQLKRECEQLIATDEQIISELEAKIEFYDNVDCKSGALFFNGKEMRNNATTILNEISKSSVVNGKYTSISTDKVNGMVNQMDPSTLNRYNNLAYTMYPDDETTVEKNVFEKDVINEYVFGVGAGVSLEQGVEYSYSAYKRSDPVDGSFDNGSRDLSIGNVTLTLGASGGILDENNAIAPSINETVEVEMSYFDYNSTSEVAGVEVEKSVSVGNLKGSLNNGVDIGRDGKLDLNIENGISMSALDVDAAGSLETGDFVFEYSIDSEFLSVGIGGEGDGLFDWLPEFKICDFDGIDFSITKKN